MVNDDFINRARDIILNNIEDEGFGVSSLADKLNLSRSQTNRKIKAITGASASHFIKEVRLDKAKELLKNSDLNISEIAFLTGFGSLSYFDKCFHEKYGITPGTFKKSESTILTLNPADKSFPANKYWISSVIGFSLLIIVFLLLGSYFDENERNVNVYILPITVESENREYDYLSKGFSSAMKDELNTYSEQFDFLNYSIHSIDDLEIDITESFDTSGDFIIISGTIKQQLDSFKISIQILVNNREEFNFYYSSSKQEVLSVPHNVSSKINKLMTEN
ncbi:AraC family transcriptional regulator [Mangrovivirga sp. M17]|uniref:AraC family transcriptional regulator n=1 Tax=Mangrovivirga halotolerans TaxID=2993936 RepID=A0ABT3RPY8_9BACT|nr:AraC family transcriptional regulator [Mangrovivirga halotolerans]MCX2743861.1 AraC family transcriptional regulator [Mangrovivirga halotolerans]